MRISTFSELPREQGKIVNTHRRKEGPRHSSGRGCARADCQSNQSRL